jgi:hypothetical protein
MWRLPPEGRHPAGTSPMMEFRTRTKSRGLERPRRRTVWHALSGTAMHDAGDAPIIIGKINLHEVFKGELSFGVREID